MHGIGTIVNFAAIIIGSVIGATVKGGLPKRFQDTVMSAVGLAVIFIGVGGAVSGLVTMSEGGLTTQNTMMMVLSLVLGAVVGEAIDLETRLERLGQWTKRKMPAKIAGNTFVEGFVNASILFCVGAMAVVGSLEDGINGNYSILFAKSVLDGISALIFAASMGFGVALSAVPVLIYQGLITLLAQYVQPYLASQPLLIPQMSCVGSVLIFAIGINVMFGKKIKVANLLPAIFFPILFVLIKTVWPGFPV